MNKAIFEQKLIEILQTRQRNIIADESCTKSAVLVPLSINCENSTKITEEAISIYFIRRSQNVLHHAGNIAFPGGRVDEKDADIIQTAVREATEEINLQPENIKILGLLDDVLTLTSGFIITPVLALINQTQFKMQLEEVTEIFAVPYNSLLQPDAKKAQIYEFEEKCWTLTDYFYRDKKIWGATSRILSNLIDILSLTLK